jgi:hypothetical protein
MAKTPVAINLVCCENLILEEGTRNITLVNCFVRREAKSFPTDSISFIVFAILTDGAGEMPLAIVISGLDSLEQIYREERRIELTNPLQEIGSRFLIRDCVFPAAGYYEVSLVANREFIAHRRIRLVERSKLNEPDSQSLRSSGWRDADLFF